jgi:hypothetical protein
MRKFIKPGVALFEMAETLESCVRSLIEERGLDAGACSRRAARLRGRGRGRRARRASFAPALKPIPANPCPQQTPPHKPLPRTPSLIPP